VDLIAIDIGNTSVKIGLFLTGQEKAVRSVCGDESDQLKQIIRQYWGQINESTAKDAVVVSSVKPEWAQKVTAIVPAVTGRRALMLGRDIPLPIEIAVDEPSKVGTDRAVGAAAAFAVVQNAVVVADFGTAVTIDLVDDRGIFRGGAILPGFEISAKALRQYTAGLPEIEVTRPGEPFGRNTTQAINCGLYYSAIGALEELVRRYAERIGRWPQTVITGRAAELIKDDCGFVDQYVPNLVLKGLALAYRKFIDKTKQQDNEPRQ